eukprot:TRINITY_DN2367_c0_g1_i1.p1 TRINITY_DN2367_c0_g1~~TRINITY_DN2367_c0_g1_i1.p1  ORF type:complete len:155 (+),score=28.54 TRINITY_DN2367_c0_g1_i1:48-512(+)
MIHFVLLISRQGKARLTRYYSPYSDKEKARIVREASNLILSRPAKMCNFVEWKNHKIVYRRYASLYFMFGVDQEDNELITLELIHSFVEILDAYFGNVCELDLVFHFHKAFYILDELIIAGEQQETSKQLILRMLREQDVKSETVISDDLRISF